MRTRVFYDKPETACYGCQSCAEICPKDAITMHPDKEGFLFPHISPKSCIECNLCEKSCPTQEKNIKNFFNDTPKYVDAAWSNNINTRFGSTSGGLFSIIAKFWIENNGVIYGAAFDGNLNVSHRRVNTLKGIEDIRGSKYVQSNLNGIFKSIKQDLTDGKKVLFSGTPCQVAGLKTFLKKEYPTLLTIDLVCHGVPSPLIWNEHINYVEKKYGHKLIDYKFRGKKKTGWRAYIKYIFKDHSPVSKCLGDDFYAQCFYESRINRRSCYQCEFSKQQRLGDITLSDFWGAEKSSKQLRIQRKHGFNMVMCNTPKGEIIYKSIHKDITFLTLPCEIAINGDIRLRQAEKAPTDRNSIFSEYYEHGYEWLVSHRSKRKSLISTFSPIWVKNLIYELKARL